MFGCSERAPVNIYESEKFRNLTQEEITIGESIWVTTSFRCHMYGTMGGTSVKDKEHFDKSLEERKLLAAMIKPGGINTSWVAKYIN